MMDGDANLILQKAIDAQRSGDIDTAARLYEDFIAAAPPRPEGYVNLGMIKQNRGDLAAAEDLYRRAIDAAPNEAFPHLNLGVVHIHKGEVAAAQSELERAVSLQPNLAPARFNLAGIYQRQYRFEDALAQLDAILKNTPTDLPANMARVPLLFELGRLKEAWDAYAHRSAMFPNANNDINAPLWRGEHLTGQKLALVFEQGLGEQIMFASLVPEMTRETLALTLECEARLAPLFARSFPNVNVVPWSQPRGPEMTNGGFDVYAPMGDAAVWRRRTFEDFPRHEGYLKADEARSARLREEYLKQSGGKKLVGVSWHSAAPQFGLDKSLPQDALSALLDNANVQWVNLQYGPEANFTHANMLRDDAIDPTQDMDAFAAQVAAMDLVVSVSNSTAHLAGALGKPVWALLPKTRNRRWYWFAGRDPNPWYPSLKSFVQTEDGAWGNVIQNVNAALAAFS